jgi:hypothetical protein
MNCKSFFLLLTISLFLCNPLYADTIPGGDVSGIWYADSTPHYITGDITIPAGDTLIIEPGVLVNFLGDYSLTANGVLEAIGTESDSIRFFPEDTISGWQGIDIENGTVFTYPIFYCSFQYASTALELGFFGLDADILHCSFRNNDRAIVVAPIGIANLQITDCVFRNNGPTTFGAAINCMDAGGPVSITGCLFENNTADIDGGAIRVRTWSDSTITITDCVFRENYADSCGGAIYFDECDDGVIIERCTFGDNRAYGVYTTAGGGAIFVSSVNNLDVSYSCFYYNSSIYGGSIRQSGGGVTLDHCTFWHGAGLNEIYTGGSSATTLDVNNCIFTHLIEAIGNDPEITLTVGYSDFHDNTDDIEDPPAGFGVLDRVNYNGDSCDVYHNIFMDPMFADTLNFDLHLTAGSPCIDAGDTLFALDPDSTVADMGAYYFDQRTPEIELPVSLLDFDTVTVGDSSSLSFNIYNIGDGNLLLYDITNSLAVFTNDWNPSDSIVLPGDSLEITVTFNPNDTLSFTDTLRIDNNDSLVYVELMGIGKPVSGISEDILASPLLELCGTNPATTFPKIRFGMPKGGKINLSVYDITGRCVKTLADGEYDAGIHEVTLDGTALSQGVYFCVMKAGETCLRRKLVLLK